MPSHLFIQLNVTTFGRTQNVSRIVSLNTAALSHRKPATAGTSQDRCSAQRHHKRNSLNYKVVSLRYRNEGHRNISRMDRQLFKHHKYYSKHVIYSTAKFR
jgi:hypothetical protein